MSMRTEPELIWTLISIIVLLSSTTFLWGLELAQTLDGMVKPAVLDTHGQCEQGLYQLIGFVVCPNAKYVCKTCCA